LKPKSKRGFAALQKTALNAPNNGLGTSKTSWRNQSSQIQNAIRIAREMKQLEGNGDPKAMLALAALVAA
jgi:hypothetical protein